MVKLSDGRQVSADLTRMTIGEFRGLLSADQPEAEGDAILARVFGLEPAEIEKLPFPDYRALSRELFDRARNPEGTRPNSPGGSTGT